MPIKDRIEKARRKRVDIIEVVEPEKRPWRLVDSSHKRFNRWEALGGYSECFWKEEDPNELIPYGYGVPVTSEGKIFYRKW